MGLGVPELILLFIILAFYLLFPVWGYNAGSKRTIGGFLGAVLGFFFNIIGIIIIYLMPRVDDTPKFYNFNTASSADELQKYKQLLDSGAITEEEYQFQKKKILNW